MAEPSYSEHYKEPLQPEERPDILFETSWEVCNKVGGIYTVVSSKVIPLIRTYGKNYYLIGPYFYDSAKGVFKELAPPPEFKSVCSELEKEGIILHFGTWLVKGDPQVILIDFSGFCHHTDQIKKEFWDAYKIDSLGTQFHDYDEPMVWSYVVGKCIEKVKGVFHGKKIVAHFHEWMSGGGLLYLKNHHAGVGTIFTTHATMLGRTIAGSNVDLYANLQHINPLEEAYRRGMPAKHLTEVACARTADVFTTVSKITGKEAEYILGKRPDVLLPNGLDIEEFPTFDELSIQHHVYKLKFHEFLMYYFFPYYSFNLDNTFLFFTVGRFEYHVKGYDIFIDALADLNQRLKSEQKDVTVVVFFFVPSAIRGIRPELLEHKMYFTDLKDFLDDNIKTLETRLLQNLLATKDIRQFDLFLSDEKEDITRKLLRLSSNGTPPICTHNLQDPSSNMLVNSMVQKGLTNSREDPVKVVYYPIYLSGADSLLDLEYYEMIKGAHLGVFPSVYEPWGYTPLESAALGVSSVTADTAGFGQYIRGELKKDAPGIGVISRLGKSYDEARSELGEELFRFTQLTRSERVKSKIEARRLASKADWSSLIRYYLQAHSLAVKHSRV